MPPQSFAAVGSTLARVGRRFYARGWALGTSGNFSVVMSRRPLRLAITQSGVSKREFRPAHILQCDERGGAVGRTPGRPSAEAFLHIEIARRRRAGAVLHTHSVWSTVLSGRHAAEGGLLIEGYEMLKGLKGVTSHEHREWIPILENDQDMRRLARAVGQALAQHEHAHALLLQRHGLYTWGDTLEEAERHVEILEFLLETVGRARTDGGTSWPA